MTKPWFSTLRMFLRFHRFHRDQSASQSKARCIQSKMFEPLKRCFLMLINKSSLTFWINTVEVKIWRSMSFCKTTPSYRISRISSRRKRIFIRSTIFYCSMLCFSFCVSGKRWTLNWMFINFKRWVQPYTDMLIKWYDKWKTTSRTNGVNLLEIKTQVSHAKYI